MINKGEFNMSTNNYNSSLNVEEGILNLISASSSNESDTIIFKSDLNGNIIPKDVNVWHWVVRYLWWTQNNNGERANFVGATRDIYVSMDTYSWSKNATYFKPYSDEPVQCLFKPVIKYIE